MTPCPDIISESLRKSDDRITKWSVVIAIVLTALSFWLVKDVPL